MMAAATMVATMAATRAIEFESEKDVHVLKMRRIRVHTYKIVYQAY